MKKIVCVMCGKEYEISNSKDSYLCLECTEKINLIKKLEMVDKAKIMLEKKRGKCRSLKPKIDVSNFADKVKKRVSDGTDAFSSVPETAVAIQMQKIGLEYETQKEIAGKRVDFYIPEIKVILEIDGEIYHTDDGKTFLRDRKIMSEIGESWEIVHIDAKDVPKYTWNLRESLRYIGFERNDRWRFRDSLLDSDLLKESVNLNRYLKRSI